jgi:hypothetical protein
MVDIEDAPRLRALCELASKEYDHEKLIELVRQINDLLEKRRNEDEPGEEKKASPVLGLTIPIGLSMRSIEEWVELYPWIVPASS